MFTRFSFTVLVIFIFNGCEPFVVEFPDYNTALECYDSAEYQEAHNVLEGHVVRHHQIVEGN